MSVQREATLKRNNEWFSFQKKMLEELAILLGSLVDSDQNAIMEGKLQVSMSLKSSSIGPIEPTKD
jgi:hypothetical protein